MCSEFLSDLHKIIGEWRSRHWNQLCHFEPASSPLGVNLSFHEMKMLA